jgi:hypothetical protein
MTKSLAPCPGIGLALVMAPVVAAKEKNRALTGCRQLAERNSNLRPLPSEGSVPPWNVV